MEIKEFIRLNLVYVLYIIGVFLGWNIIILYFSRMGYNYIEISSYFLVLSLTSFIFLIFPQNLNIKKLIARIIHVITSNFTSRIIIYPSTSRCSRKCALKW